MRKRIIASILTGLLAFGAVGCEGDTPTIEEEPAGDVNEGDGIIEGEEAGDE